MTFDYDLFVIGGGSGGVRAGRVAAATGAKVALAEEFRMGGTCVIRGCVPKKLMVFASTYSEMFEDARAYGWDVTDGAFDWPRFRGKLDAELERLEGIYRKLLNGSDVTIYDARATIKDAHTVTLSTGEDITAKHILVATGGRPVLPHIEGAEYGITSNEVFNLEQLPKSILIVGGGYIASEFAGIMNGLGCKVTQFYRGEQILRGFDNEARGLVAEGMRAKGVDLHLGTNVLKMEKRDEGIWVQATNGSEAIYDQVMFATGRAPNTEGMGLAEVGVELGRRGEIIVDQYSQTKVPSIFAIGDVTDRVQLTPVAIREGMAFVETVFKGNPTPVDHDLIPSAVFTQPELGTIGLTEEEAAENGPIEVYSTSFKPMNHGFAGRDDRVLMKLIVCAETRKVLGCHIVADHAGEMIQLAGIAVKMGATKEDFDRTVAVHPTMAEELVTMKEPVRTA
ncbi:glutathione-disulfide reductase [Loktanella sp. S4079]|uniref:glutathione-disulfide reductase n=1 Tax=Loktanella sp. S4079 TaxID=579483 RepID=UPI0005FA40CC|nr:glutathione-disulfide reductase [Loktanella sp. S4079]KJZ20546.1 NADPH-glutathione reductase [Loktanella sp. S4079]